MKKTALIVGSTGLTGSHLLSYLLNGDEYDKVIAFSRKETEITHPKLTKYIIDFSYIESYKDLIQGDDFFCCLGTTIKKAGSQEVFEIVDLHFPSQFATLASKNDVKQFAIITAIGSDAKSSNFYLRTKGKCEENIKALAFASTLIFRPSLLIGNRGEFRMGEKVSAVGMKFLNFFMIGKLRKYKSIKAQTVAQGMYLAAQVGQKGLQIYESDRIQDIVKK